MVSYHGADINFSLEGKTAVITGGAAVIGSATAQFFINLADNAFLDHTGQSAQGWGYCVFGKVTEGMDVVDAIARLKTASQGMHDDVPTEMVLITAASRFG